MDIADIDDRFLANSTLEAQKHFVTGNTRIILQWWIEVARLVSGLAWRSRAWHFRMVRDDGQHGQWFVGLPPTSTQLPVLQSIALVHDVLAGRISGGRADPQQLAQLADLLKASDPGDHLTQTTAALQHAVQAESLDLDLVASTGIELVKGVHAMANEFEGSAPHDRDANYTGPLNCNPIDAPFTPAPGESRRVIAHAAGIAARLFDMQMVVR